tara:strand:- start:540 stop:686 length:147 start_codon:yes stop_codon:yes gene_type:complete
MYSSETFNAGKDGEKGPRVVYYNDVLTGKEVAGTTPCLLSLERKTWTG